MMFKWVIFIFVLLLNDIFLICSRHILSVLSDFDTSCLSSLITSCGRDHLTAAEPGPLVSFLETAAWYIASRSFTDTCPESGSPTLSGLSSGRPDLDLPRLPAAGRQTRHRRLKGDLLHVEQVSSSRWHIIFVKNIGCVFHPLFISGTYGNNLD